jgi:hypothetical protein
MIYVLIEKVVELIIRIQNISIYISKNFNKSTMSFNGSEGEKISLSVASAMTKNYRDNAGANPTLAHYIGRDLIEEILAQEGCVGIRIYYALNSNGSKELVLVGVDGDENDIVNGVIADKTVKCPQNCSTTNLLNS